MIEDISGIYCIDIYDYSCSKPTREMIDIANEGPYYHLGLHGIVKRHGYVYVDLNNPRLMSNKDKHGDKIKTIIAMAKDYHIKKYLKQFIYE